MRSSLCAFATIRGSLVYTPSTSVKISQRSAPSAPPAPPRYPSHRARRGHPLVAGDALETGQHRDLAALQAGAQPFGFDPLDARPAVDAIGAHRRLPAEEGARRQSERVQRQRQQAHGDLLLEATTTSYSARSWCGPAISVTHSTS